MSRIMFTGLPSDLTDERFRSKLTAPKELEALNVTDVRLKSKRRFAFVGYKTPTEAKTAQEYFHRSYAFGNERIQVHVVDDKQLDLHHAHVLPTTASQPDTHPIPAAETVSAEAESSRPKKDSSKSLQEFMTVMKGTDPTKPDQEPSTSTQAEVKKDKKGKGKEREAPAESRPNQEHEQDLSTYPGWAQMTRLQQKALEFKVRKQAQERAQAEEDTARAAWVKRDVEAAAPIEGEATGKPKDEHSHLPPNEKIIMQHRRLYVRNLAHVTTKDELADEFARFGEVEEAYIPVAKEKGTHKGTALGYGFILYKNAEHALAAYRRMDQTTFQGRIIHVLPAGPKYGKQPEVEGEAAQEGEGAALNTEVLGKVKQGHAEVKKKKEKQATLADKHGVNWATMYMDSDAVATSVAAKMGISKADLLGGRGANAAVALAIAEAQEIDSSKKYFEKHGIVLSSFSPDVPRSETTILVKGMKAGTTIHDLSDKFSPHGKIKKILLPPSGTFGVVEMADPTEARAAWTAVNYSRLGPKMLFLEKGPVGMFKDPGSIQTPESKIAEEQKLLAEKVSNAAGEVNRDGPAEGDESGSTLFVKNLSFTTTTERLTTMVAHLPGFSFARVQMKPDPKREGAKQSAGYGFVGFKTRKDATKAHGGLQGVELEGKTLEIKFAQRGTDDVEPSKGKGELKGTTKSTKLMVKNVAFEATKKDIRELFSAFGQIKSLRLPKKPTLGSTGSQSTRGFAFVEFTTHAEAERAKEALKHVHLLGRHLVVNWAEEDSGVDVEGLRQKVGREWTGLQAAGENQRTKKRKLEKGEVDEEMDGMES